ncbi:MAG TPA: response regulator, partial [Thermoanaerobaculia bacterium]|nr:response regulator [Thermoanaerobaculia bacterium]
MTTDRRRSILRYGIAIDLVILATGVGMLLPLSPLALVVTFLFACGLASWKGGWKGGATAAVLSVVMMVVMFGATVDGTRLLSFVAAATALIAISHAAKAARAPRQVQATAPVAVPLANVVAFDRDDETARERQTMVRSLEKTAAAQLEALRRETQRREQEAAAREAREAEERAAREREEAERVAREAKEREEREAREAEERVAREREEAERVAREEQERIAREAEERKAREAEELAEKKRQKAERIAREKAEREALEARKREEAERIKREAEEQALREGEEALRREAAAAAERALEAERERLRVENEQRLAAEAQAMREQAEAELAEKLAAERAAIEREAQERVARELEEKLNEERAAAEREAATRIEAERETLRRELEQRVAREREERLESERRAAEEEARKQIEEQVAAIHREAEEKIARARREAEEETARRVAEETAHAKAHIPPKVDTPSKGIIGTVTGWFRREPKPRTFNLTNKKISSNAVAAPSTAKRRVSTAPPPKRAAKPAPPRKPRLLLLERRRATADTLVPKAKQRGIEIEVVERWIDAIDELFRFRPDAIFIDTELPDFATVYRMIVEQNAKLPIVLTGRSASSINVTPEVHFASFAVRPYDIEQITQIANHARQQPEAMLAVMAAPRASNRAASGSHDASATARPAAPRAEKPVEKPVEKPIAPAAAPPAAAASFIDEAPALALVPAPSTRPAPAEISPVIASSAPTNDQYDVLCFNCRTPFNALDADWCSCLTKERTLVCTNCLTCFCKAPPSYKEKFWVAAPPRLFERKTAETRRQQSGLLSNPAPDETSRPLVLCVEDDEEIQAIVSRVCSNLGYGFVYATNGQDGLSVARLYRPNLILSDAFMPKLDGREMCRMLKEDPLFADTKMVVMTGLYTDTKYRSEAVKRFHVDDYIAKPVSVTELISLLQKHLEGVPSLPQEDLHAIHRAEVEEHLIQEHLDEREEMMGVPLADLLNEAIANDPLEVELDEVAPPPAPRPKPQNDRYDVACFNCSQTFDAAHAEWCRCVGRDNTVVCSHCSGCFCKAPAAYKERFWMDAPPSLFERKMVSSKR